MLLNGYFIQKIYVLKGIICLNEARIVSSPILRCACFPALTKK